MGFHLCFVFYMEFTRVWQIQGVAELRNACLGQAVFDAFEQMAVLHLQSPLGKASLPGKAAALPEAEAKEQTHRQGYTQRSYLS